MRGLRNDLELLGFTTIGDCERSLFVYLACIARHNGQGQAVLIIGNSGAGKIYLTEQILKCMPEEDRIELAAASPKALLAFPANPDGDIDLR